MHPKFSIVTISFNQAEFLPRAIESVISQKNVDLDYIVVDPGSSDGSREIIERYKRHFSHIILDPDRGPADGLNKGLAAASGDYFGYLNSDDELTPGALEKAASAFAKYPSADVVYGNGLAVDEHGKQLRRLVSASPFSPKLYAWGLAVIIQQAAFVRTGALKAIGGFNVENRTCWDGEAFLDIALAGGRFRRVWDTWGLFRIHRGSISGSGRLNEQYREDCERLFVKVFRRPSTARDRMIAAPLKAVLRARDVRRLQVDVSRALGR
jgi:glycosyltransferase involved in cell wall biosynthesis